MWSLLGPTARECMRPHQKSLDRAVTTPIYCRSRLYWAQHVVARDDLGLRVASPAACFGGRQV